MADQLVKVHRSIRRALQGPLKAAAAAAAPPIPVQWKGIPFNSVGMANYISTEIGLGGVIVHEIGPNPMVEGRGYITMVLHSPLKLGEDANDALLLLVANAYPLYSTPSFEGLSVNIDKMEHRGYGSDEPWLTGLVSVDWNIYRRS